MSNTSNLSFLVKDQDDGIGTVDFQTAQAFLTFGLNKTGPQGSGGDTGLPGPTGSQGTNAGPFAGGTGYYAIVYDDAGAIPVTSQDQVLIGSDCDISLATNSVGIATPDGSISGDRCTMISSMNSDLGGNFSTIITSNACENTADYSSVISSKNSRVLAGSHNVVVASKDSQISGGNFSGIFASDACGITGMAYNSISSSLNCKITDTSTKYSSIFSSSDSTVDGSYSVMLGSSDSIVNGGTRGGIIASTRCYNYGSTSTILASVDSTINSGCTNCAILACKGSTIPSGRTNAAVVAGNGLTSTIDNSLTTNTLVYTVAACVPSDIILKKDIEEYVGDTYDVHLPKIRDFETKKFKMKDDLDPEQRYKNGFIAQELEAIFPYTVTGMFRKMYELDWVGTGPTGATGIEYWEPQNTGVILTENDNIILDSNNDQHAYIFRDEPTTYKLIIHDHISHLLYYSCQKLIDYYEEQQSQISILTAKLQTLEADIVALEGN